MKPEEVAKNWHYEHFIALLCLYAAGVDGNISQDEIAELSARLARITDPAKANSILNDVRFAYKNWNDAQIMDMVYLLKDKFCPDEASCRVVRMEVEALIRADGRLDTNEQYLSIMLSKIFR
jgi:hypothetical protein